jgi:adenylate kinase
MRLVLLGPPGAGKGTQAVWIEAEYDVPHISTGDILRDHVERATGPGLEAKRYMEQGTLVPDAIVVEMVRERLERADAQHGFVLDGYPRTLMQAKELDAALAEHEIVLSAVIDLALPDGAVLERLAARVQCAACRTPYNLVKSPPAVEGVCDSCGGTLVPRNDDKAVKIRRRLEEYYEAIPDLRDFFESKGLFIEVDADGSLAEVEARVRAALAGVPAG